LSKARQLHELQEVDLQIDSKRQKLADVSSQIGESEALNQAKGTIVGEEERLAAMARRQRELETEVEDLKSKAAVAEDKLYGGTIKNPKELTSIQEQVKNYQKKIGEIDDSTLEIMSEEDTLEQQLSVRREEINRLEKEWKAEQESLLKQQAGLEAELAGLEDARTGLASKIDTASLELYQLLKQKRQGRAVAKVELGMCQGCRITLPVSELQKVRQGQEIVQCGSCERILYLS
jgi:predicted  nucleic acid-binding Zn-ribbon protein